jgi:hypothetical protein
LTFRPQTAATKPLEEEMATEHNDQPPSTSEKKSDFEIEDVGLEEATGGSCAGCGGGCSVKPPVLDQLGGS